MTLAQVKTMLEAITGFSTKVVYRAWPEGAAPSLPFICYLERNSNNMAADGVVYYSTKAIDIELYTKTKDTANEALVEAALKTAGIVWNKTEDYIDTEKVFMITYSIEV